MYQKDELKEYVNNSELKIFSEKIKIRLSKELAYKYDKGYYQNHLKNIQKYLDMIDSLNIKYPGNAKPVMYIYIVPDDNYSKLLKIPTIFDKRKGGGKPVRCYDLDGFKFAYGISQNMLEDKSTEEMSISKIENEIHELSHIIHSQFFSTNKIICEGFAETLPLYILDFEKMFDEHRNTIIELKEDQIYSAKELINSEKNGTYGIKEIIPGKSCSFRLSYISSYLFVRGCIEIIIQKYNYSKEKAMQYFLEIVNKSSYQNEWLIYDIADTLEISKDELLNGKQMQIKILNSL